MAPSKHSCLALDPVPIPANEFPNIINTKGVRWHHNHSQAACMIIYLECDVRSIQPLEFVINDLPANPVNGLRRIVQLVSYACHHESVSEKLRMDKHKWTMNHYNRIDCATKVRQVTIFRTYFKPSMQPMPNEKYLITCNNISYTKKRRQFAQWMYNMQYILVIYRAAAAATFNAISTPKCIVLIEFCIYYWSALVLGWVLNKTQYKIYIYKYVICFTFAPPVWLLRSTPRGYHCKSAEPYTNPPPDTKQTNNTNRYTLSTGHPSILMQLRSN